MNEASGRQFFVKIKEHFGNWMKPSYQLRTDGRIIQHNSQNINLNIGQPRKEIYYRKVYNVSVFHTYQF